MLFSYVILYQIINYDREDLELLFNISLTCKRFNCITQRIVIERNDEILYESIEFFEKTIKRINFKFIHYALELQSFVDLMIILLKSVSTVEQEFNIDLCKGNILNIHNKLTSVDIMLLNNCLCKDYHDLFNSVSILILRLINSHHSIVFKHSNYLKQVFIEFDNKIDV
jgi:hypothetical protein